MQGGGGVFFVLGASRARSSSSSASASSSAKDASTTTIGRGRKVVVRQKRESRHRSSGKRPIYEIKTGCLNARGKKFANFQQFLTAQLTRLSEDALVKNSVKSSAMVRRMKEDGVLYGQLPATNAREC